MEVTGSRAARLGSLLLVGLEAVGVVAMWSAIPFAWMWIGGRVYELTGSLAADMLVAFTGFLATTVLVMRALARVDTLWIALRRKAGHDQRDGALTQVVVVSATFAIIGFYIWFHFIERAFIIPFMPTR